MKEKNEECGAFAKYGEGVHQKGLTKREYFAGLAMNGYIVQRHAQEHLDKVKIAKWSVEIAECLLEELSK